ncbi:hypothetical protein BK133_30435 [Paenibacillus sp. FSL H8-0548]|nr:hypothetical protein BK133_30435 [Paenibacillus sp. FSL H8-0548]
MFKKLEGMTPTQYIKLN